MYRKALIFLAGAVCIGCACADLSDGLMGWWRFDSSDGTTIRDDSDQDNDGVLYGSGYDYVNGLDEWALAFNGIDDYVAIPAMDLAGFSNVSIHVIYKAPQVVDVNYGLFSWNNSGNNGGINIGIWDDRRFYVSFRDQAWTSGWFPRLFSYTIPDDDEWHIATFVYDGNARLYFDGRLEDSMVRNSTITNISSELLHLCHLVNQPTGKYHFTGTLDEIRIYNRGLTPDEVRTLYEKHFKRLDFNRDKDINSEDLAILTGEWLLSGALIADVSPIDGDDIVDLADLAVFSSEWLTSY